MGKTSRRGSRLGVESLEKRLMLSGNVDARVERGNLFILGDDEPNAIQITHAEIAWLTDALVPPVGESYWVTGLETTVNGSKEPFLATGVTGNVAICLRGGGDSVDVAGGVATDPTTNETKINPLLVPGNLLIRTDGGDDTVALKHVQVGKERPIITDPVDPATLTNTTRPIPENIWPKPLPPNGNVSIATGDGGDSVGLGNVSVKGNLAVETGAAADNVGLEGVTVGRANDGPMPQLADGIRPIPVPPNGNVRISTGGGDDVVNLVGVTVKGNLAVNTDGGADTVNVRGVKVGQNMDDPRMLGTAVAWPIPIPLGGNATISTGCAREDGADIVNIVDMVVQNRFGLNTGAGKDQIKIEALPTLSPLPAYGLKAKYVDIVTATDADFVELNNVLADRLRVDLGLGPDTLAVSNSTTTQSTLLIGGPLVGDPGDTLKQDNNTFAKLQVLGFEYPPPPTPLPPRDPMQEMIDRMKERYGQRGSLGGILGLKSRDR